MSPPEFDRLAGRLATAGSWERLWPLALDASPARALALVARFPAGWQPPREGDRRLFGLLAAAAPEMVSAAAVPYRRCLQVPAPRCLHDVSFDPDGAEVAVLGRPGFSRRRDRLVLDVYRLPGGEPAWRHDFGRVLGQRTVAHAGAGAVLVAAPTLYRLTTGSGGVTSEPLDEVDEVRQVAGGFVAVGRDHLLLRGGPAGPPDRGRSEAWAYRLAVEPGTGRLAVADLRGGHYDQTAEPRPPDHLLLLDPAGRVLARGIGTGQFRAIAFAGPDRLVSTGLNGGLDHWRRDGAALTAVATYPLDGFGDLLVPPGIGKLAAGGSHYWQWFDTTTLDPVTAPVTDSLGWLYVSPDGGWLASGTGEHELALHRLLLPPWLAALADRPLAAAGPDDLPALPPDGAVTAPHARHWPDDTTVATGVAVIVRACLEHRFGTDLELGTGPATAEHDISLSRPDGTA